MTKKRLFTPGPTPVPEQVMLAMAQPVIHHRHPEFEELFKRVNENLKYLFQTDQDVLTLSSSGTGAMEAAVCNLFSPGDRVITVNAGKFGERWGELCRAFGLEFIEIPVEWGRGVDPEIIEHHLLTMPDAKAIFLTHSETSTGALQNIREIARLVRTHTDALTIVDGITSVGAVELRMDEWDLDVVMTGSQKGLMVPPGLSFIALSDRAWKRAELATLPKYYFDLLESRRALKTSETPWTPAVTLVVGLDVALQMLRTEGIENVWSRHAILAEAVRTGCNALGLQLLASEPSNALTAIWIPEMIDAKKLLRSVKTDHGITVAGGQGHLTGKIFRISHLGYYDRLDVVSVIAAIELSLAECGWTAQPGTGVSAVQEVFARAATVGKLSS